MGVPAPIPKGTRRPSAAAYFVALGGILILLILLCLYFFYFFIRKVKELSSVDPETLTTTSCRSPPAATAAYPVQPVVRESATAMAMLCKQVPAPGKGGTVFPTSTSPAALRASTGEAELPPAPDPAPAPASAPAASEPDGEPRPEKAPPVPAVPTSVVLEVPAR